MKRLLWLIFMMWAISIMCVRFAMSGLFYADCAASLEFSFSDVSNTLTRLYDVNTGIALNQQFPNEANLTSPDENYRYDIPWYTGNDNDVFLIDNREDSRDLVYSSPFITNVIWSADSRMLLIWEFDGTREQSILTGMNIETQDINFTHTFPPTIGRRRIASPDNRYIYVQFPLDVMRFTFGVMFVDTVTGRISEFAEPTEFPYVWSGNTRWVASQFQDMIQLISPLTGDYHPLFGEAILGEGFVWDENNLWYTRDDAVWMANIVDGTNRLMISDATLDIVNSDAGWATIFDGGSDFVLYNIETGTRYPLGIAEQFATHRHLVAFSANGQCAAILLTAYQHQAVHNLLIYDLANFQQTHQQVLYGELNTMHWVSARSD